MDRNRASPEFSEQRSNKMKQKILSILSLAMAALLIAACAPQAQSSATTELDQASLIEALRATGAEVELGDSVEQAFFAVLGQILKLDGTDVQVFEYESAQAMEADVAQVSADGDTIGNSMVTWVATPHFFKSGRVLVLFVGDDAAVLELLGGVLGEQFAGR
jgi:hypothetical protein